MDRRVPVVSNSLVLEIETFGRLGLKRERRRSQRDALTGSLTIIWGDQSQQECLAQANLVDVSDFGAQFRLPVRVPPGAWLMFNHHRMGIGGRGTVRHCRLIKGMYQIGVEVPSGTGWNIASHRFAANLRNLAGAIDPHQTGRVSDETGVTTGEAIPCEVAVPR
jgi:hypothetical protein